MRYPGQIKKGEVSKRTLCSIDLMPTIAKLAGASLPANPIDGMDVWDLITDKQGARNPHEYYAFSTNREFEGVISGDGRWKLHVPHGYRTLVNVGNDGAPGQYRQEKIDWSLFDMEGDPNETTNVLEKFPEVAERMKRYAEEHRKAFYS
jgi:arylsulfatase A-like enzyme